MKKNKKLGRSAYVLSVVLFIAGIFCLLLTFSGWRAFFPKVDLSELTAQTQMKEKTVVGERSLRWLIARWWAMKESFIWLPAEQKITY